MPFSFFAVAVVFPSPLAGEDGLRSKHGEGSPFLFNAVFLLLLPWFLVVIARAPPNGTVARGNPETNKAFVVVVVFIQPRTTSIYNPQKTLSLRLPQGAREHDHDEVVNDTRDSALPLRSSLR
jgi:hypothetical protein